VLEGEYLWERGSGRLLFITLFFSTTLAVFFSERTTFSSHNKSTSAAAKFQRNEPGHVGQAKGKNIHSLLFFSPEMLK
jgi:hypothetical protein